MIHWMGLVMAVSNSVMTAITNEAVGSVAAYTAMNGFDFVTQTYDAIEMVSFNSMVAKKQGKKGNDMARLQRMEGGHECRSCYTCWNEHMDTCAKV